MSIFNGIISAVFDGFFTLTGMLGGMFALVLISAIAGVLFLYLFKLTSNQTRIRQIKDRIGAGFLEVRLFKDDIGQMMRAQGTIFGNAFRYMGQAFRPMAFMIVPVILMLIQMNLWYGYAPLKPETSEIPLKELLDRTGLPHDVPLDPDKSAVIVARFKPDSFQQVSGDVRLETDDGVEVVTPAVRIPALNEVNWRIVARKEGRHTITLHTGGSAIEHAVYVGEPDAFRKIEPMLTSSAWDQLWHPGSKPLPGDAAVTQFTVEYPEGETKIFGFELHWVIIFFILSLVFGFSLKGVMGVEI